MNNRVGTMDEGLPLVATSQVGKARRAPFRHWLPLLLAVVASGLLFSAAKLPLWQMRMEAPQYKDEEALQVAVFAGAFKGDMAELAVLNQYIGVHVPQTLPQFAWLPYVLLGGAALCLLAAFLPSAPRGIALACLALGLAGALFCAMLQAKSQMHDIGHKRDSKTILAGVHDFTPPLLGSTRVAQFHVSSRFGTGAWLLAGALGLQAGAAWLSRRKPQPR